MLGIPSAAEINSMPVLAKLRLACFTTKQPPQLLMLKGLKPIDSGHFSIKIAPLYRHLKKGEQHGALQKSQNWQAHHLDG